MWFAGSMADDDGDLHCKLWDFPYLTSPFLYIFSMIPIGKMLKVTEVQEGWSKVSFFIQLLHMSSGYYHCPFLWWFNLSHQNILCWAQTRPILWAFFNLWPSPEAQNFWVAQMCAPAPESWYPPNHIYKGMTIVIAHMILNQSLVHNCGARTSWMASLAWSVALPHNTCYLLPVCDYIGIKIAYGLASEQLWLSLPSGQPQPHSWILNVSHQAHIMVRYISIIIMVGRMGNGWGVLKAE